MSTFNDIWRIGVILSVTMIMSFALIAAGFEYTELTLMQKATVTLGPILMLTSVIANTLWRSYAVVD